MSSSSSSSSPAPVLSAGRLARVLHGTGAAPGGGQERAGSTGPAYLTLALAIRQAIGDGRVAEGSRMPSERELTAPLGLSRTTVTKAYAVLREQGYLRTRRGSGSLVRVPPVPGGRVDHLLSPSGLDEDALDLTCTAPSAPSGTEAAYGRALERLRDYLPGTGYYPSGLPVLREKVAQRLTDRGLATTPDQVLITSGALAGAAIAVRALTGRGGRVLVESPTYPNAIATLDGAGARIVPHPIEHRAHDWDLPGLTSLVRQTGVNAAYLIPDFHNPTAALMSAEQRVEVGRLLRSADVVPIIDESLVDLPLDGQPMPPPLGAQVPDAVTVGSASKWLWGGLRIGWMRVPHARVDAMAASRLRLDLGAPVLEQLVVAELLDEADRVLAERRTALQQGRDAMLAAVRDHLPDWQVTAPTGGMALWCELPEPRSTALAVAARSHGVALASGPNFAPSGGLDRWIRLPYVLPVERLAEAGPRLAAAWADALRDGATARAGGASARNLRIIA